MADINVFYDGPIVTRKEALERGMKFYFTGKPCKKGHIAKRNIAKMCCRQCTYESTLRWNAKSKDKRQLLWKNWYGKNRQRVLDEKRLFHAENRDLRAEQYRRWAKRNPEYFRVRESRRRARKVKAKGSHTKADIRNLLETQGWKCANCRRSLRRGYHVDHIHPLSKGGSNDKYNLQMLCAFCNLSKKDKSPAAWARENGRLL